MSRDRCQSQKGDGKGYFYAYTVKCKIKLSQKTSQTTMQQFSEPKLAVIEEQRLNV